MPAKRASSVSDRRKQAKSITSAKHRAYTYSTDYFRLLVETTLDGIIVVDKDGLISYESPTVGDMLGRAPAERTGKSAFEFVHQDDMAIVAELLESLMKHPGATDRRTVRVQHADESWRHIEVVGRNMLDHPAVMGIVTNLRDVGELVKEQEALALARERYQTIFENSAIAITVTDEDERIVAWNKFAESMLGMGNEDLYLKPVRTLYQPAEWKRIRAKNIRREGMQHHIETRVIKKDGAIIDVDLSVSVVRSADGEITGSIGILADTTERKRAEEALRRSEEYYRSLLENALDATMILNGDGSIRYQSPSIRNITGYEPHEREGKSVFDLIHPEDIPRAIEEFGRLFRNEVSTINTEFTLKHKDGSWYTIEAVGKNLLDDERITGIVANFRDITERKHVENIVRVQRDLGAATSATGSLQEGLRLCLQAALDVSGMDCGAIFLVDETSGSLYIAYHQDVPADLVAAASFLEADSPNAQLVFAGEPVYATYPDVPIPNDEHETRESLAAAAILPVLNEGRVMACLTVASHTLGEVPQWARSALESVAAQMGSTIARLKAGKARRESEERLRRLLEDMNDGYCVLRGSKILFANQRIAAMFGHEPGDIIGRSIVELLPHQALLDLSEVRARRCRGEEVPKQYETVLTSNDGEPVPVELSTRTIEYAGQPALSVVARDIGERKRAEAEKERMEQQLLLSGRLAAVGQLAAGVAHELNNPLAAVQGLAQFLATRKDLDASVREDVDTIFREAQRASRITGNLLSFARKHSPEKTMVCLNDVVEQSLELHEYRLRVNNIEVVLDLAPELPKTMADFHQMQQVFVNIITNAEQAMTEAHSGGTLQVKSEVVGESIRITITDDGPGIAQEEIGRIFDPFYTTKDVGKGTGLGLSICFGIIEGHGGVIHATSAPGEGATFTLELPIVIEEASALFAPQQADPCAD